MTEIKKEQTAAQMLHEARTSGRRKREISTISRVLCVREEYLEALETGNYNVIPEVVYILGFARNYAMELGLDPAIIVHKIKLEMGLIIEEEPVVVVPEEKTHYIQDIQIEQKTAKKEFSGQTVAFFKENMKWLAVIAVATIIAILSISVIISISSDSGKSQADELNAAAQNADMIKEPEYRTKVRETFGNENRKSANIIIQASTESLLKIEDARGNTVFSRTLVTGDVYYMPLGDKYKGTFGNAGAIDIWVDSELAPSLGELYDKKYSVAMTKENLLKKNPEE